MVKLNGVFSPTKSIKGFIPQIKDLTEEEWCIAQLGNDSSKTYAEYLKERSD